MERAVRAAELRRAGLKFREIAERMGVTCVETARAAVSKGERILKRRLSQTVGVSGEI